MTVINTNYLSLVSQNNLRTSQSALGSAIERLSSGLRINNAKDDAAGQAISNRMTAQIRGMTQAARNANDGISLAQTAEGNLKEVNNNLQRIRELAVQAANGTYNAKDKEAIQTEINQRLEEIDRVAKSAQFNGINLLDGKTKDIKFQVGAGTDPETNIITVKSSKTGTLFGVQADAGDKNPGDKNAGEKKSGVALIDATTSGLGLTKLDVTKEAAGSTPPDGGNGGNPPDGGNGGTPGGGNGGTPLAALYGNTQADAPSGAQEAIKSIDEALEKVDTARANLGAVQNRLESTVNNLNNTINNLSASRSRIEDADYAVEVSNMTRAQILQQAGTAVLAQANQVPQTVLSLLR